MAIGSSQWMYASDGYQIQNSLRFDRTRDCSVVKNFSSAGNRRIFTISFWYKSTGLETGYLIEGGDADSDGSRAFLRIENGFFRFAESSGQEFTTTAAFRDVSAWIHVVLAVDTTDGTAANRIKFYVNGVQQTFSTVNYPSQNTDYGINKAENHTIGRSHLDNNNPINAYLAEYIFVDGTVYEPTEFGEYNKYGGWQPIKPQITFGQNGFHLDFASSGVGTAGTATVGADRSGNGHHFTSSGTVTTDQMLDTPTNNFCVLNTLGPRANEDSNTYLEGNLKAFAGGSDRTHIAGTMVMPRTGKWYWEVVGTDDSVYTGCAREVSTNNHVNGARPDTDNYLTGMYSVYTDEDAVAYIYRRNTAGVEASRQTVTSVSGLHNAVIGVAFDQANTNIKFYKEGTLIKSIGSGAIISGDHLMDYVPFIAGQGSEEQRVNFGQDSSFAGYKTAGNNTDENGRGDFFTAPPAGYLALCTKNLPEPAVIPSDYFNTVLWTGNDADNRSISGVGFKPDFHWNKARNRNGGDGHYIYDALRGATKVLYSNANNAEATEANALQAFESDGFQMGSDGNSNSSSYNYVGWNWKANGVGASNTDGSINTTKTSAVPEAGFSISTYTGTGANATIGHGLSLAPQMVIVKRRNASEGWAVLHRDLASGVIVAPGDFETDFIELHTTSGPGDSNTRWNDTIPSSSVFSIGTHDSVNADDSTYVAYAFHDVDGYCKVGYYNSVQNADGPFVNLGFRPAWVLAKFLDDGASWRIMDNKRAGSNPNNSFIIANSNAAESTTNEIDFFANGFKLRAAGDINYSTTPVIYLAFAETPFKYSNGR